MNGFMQNSAPPASPGSWSPDFAGEVAAAAPEIGAYWRLENPLRLPQDQLADVHADELLKIAARADEAGLLELGGKIFVSAVAARTQRELEPAEVATLVPPRGHQQPPLLAYGGAS